MQSLYLLPQVLSTTTLPHHYNMSIPTKSYPNPFTNDIQVLSVQAEFAASTITLVDPPAIPLPRTPTPEPVHTPAERPHLTIAPDSDTEEGKIVSRVHSHNYPLSLQSSLNIMQGHPELDMGTL